MHKLLIALFLSLSLSVGFIGCADDIDARGSKVDTETDSDPGDETEGAAGDGADDDDECAAACDNDECVAACND